MGRSTRAVRNWTEESVSDFTVAEHRYTWDRDGAEDALKAPGEGHRIRDWRAALPYQVGDVIWVERNDKPVRAKIIDIVVEYDRYDDRRPAYQCQTETARGIWSKVWSRFYPSSIQRGYLLAGLAPDLEGNI